ncbi:MAG: hypothetical protein OEX04_13680 [Acidimicrobiia bacterium]|nr:hypothetical protein [Acidimicrobiia bacterium]MDH4308520.1 hypothetical protein [Acidimicrobiia bacterium]MDH5292214.1 hypothetical protein [Acidimicrobiia bacterium]
MIIGTLTEEAPPATTAGVPRTRHRPRPTRLVSLALVAAVVAVAADIAVGVIVAEAARADLLRARASIHQSIVDGFVEDGLLPLPGDPVSAEALDEAVELKLLGGEAVRVKLWDVTGEVLYSDAEELIGQRFELGENVLAALSGNPGIEVDETDGAENETEAGFGSLIEYYLPVTDGGAVVAAFEIYEESSAFTSSLKEIRGHVWTAVAIGVAAIGIGMGAVMLAWILGVNRRRREAESLLGEVLTASDDERRRIVGSLHDDIGQPLYRVLYGLEGVTARLDTPALTREIDGLKVLVREIDGALRTELRTLHSGLVDGDDFDAALERLAEATRFESGLAVEVTGSVRGVRLSSTGATALFRATQEAVINARKHASASVLRIRVAPVSTGVEVTVEDDGVGWGERDGMGLSTTRQRLAAIGGGLRVKRLSPRGTRFVAYVPGDRR